MVTNVRDQNGAEQVIVFVPTDMFANKTLRTFGGMIQSFLAVY